MRHPVVVQLHFRSDPSAEPCARRFASPFHADDEVVDYFERAMDLFETLPTYDWLSAEGIVPSRTKTYTADALQAAIKKHYGHDVYFGCNSAGELDEVWYYFVTRGPVAGGKYVPVEVVGSKGSCPACVGSLSLSRLRTWACH